MIAAAGAHETQAALTVMQPAPARANVALQPAVVGAAPISGGDALKGFDCVAHGHCRSGSHHPYFGVDLARRQGWAERFPAGIETIMPAPRSVDSENRVRPPAVAGVFYPGAAADLAAAVADLLAATAASADAPKAVIVPHAGYVYSGAVAARALAQFAPDAGIIRRVAMFGPAHRVYVRGLAAPAAAAFATPLGEVPVDRSAIESVADMPQVVIDDRVHAEEHSLEVQLPILQRVLPHFALVPFAVGETTGGEVAEVIERLWGGPETRFVISSDLSHYLAYSAAQRIDAETAAAIERFDAAALTHEHACGRTPIAGFLAAARRRGLSATRLDLKNSGDTAGPKSRVVGYGAWAFS